ncbi:efflux RND transporter periplasmic adaptor subunit [Colwellia asteriadis]|uniref:Efflux RND transporter periplasmic adaptor subunit n=1 Tax=Colwellia asteriadis TaxID=517723 RepID=A0ABP3WES9_9GAMM
MRTLSLLVITLLIGGCNEKTTTNNTAVRPIAWTEVTLSTLEQVRVLSGIVAPVEATKLSFEVSGKIEGISVNLGDEVTKGQTLAFLNKRSFTLEQQSAQAKYEQAKVSLADSKSTYARYQQLLKQGVVSQSGFDNAKATFENNKSAVDVAKAQLDITTKNLQDSILIAPYDAIITRRLFEPSQQITSGQSVFEIEGKHGLEIQIMVPETLIQELTRDAIIPIKFPVLPQVKISGRISEIGTRAESANAFPVTVVLQGENPLLRAGMSAEVEFMFAGKGRTGHQGPSIRIPLTAIKAGLAQKTYVYVFNSREKIVEQREIKTENILNNQVYISAGLQPGDIIATAGVAFLRDGQQVSLLSTQHQLFN